MFKDELTLLVQMANNYMAGVSDAGFNNKNGLKDIEDKITKECHRIKTAWTRLLFDKVKDPALKRYISFQQKIVREVADHLHRQLSSPTDNLSKADAANLEVQSILLGCLLDLKDFQIKYFNQYIDENDKIPDASLPLVKTTLSDAAKSVKNAFQDIQIDMELKICLLNYFDNCSIDNQISGINYNHAEYVLSLAKSLIACFLFEESGDLTKNVIDVLFYFNFNHISFCKWYKDDIIQKRISVEQYEQILHLQAELIKLKSFQVMSKIAYNPKIPSLNIQLEMWLNELIRQKKLLIDIEYVQSEKIELKLTVAELALLIRLLYEEGVFGVKNITGLLRFFSSHFVTKKQGNISNSSMINHYYTKDKFNGSTLRELLLRMVAKINKLYFPA
jgi:hypothetical protein